MRLIGLSGKARSGKDAVADMCASLYGWRKMKLADPLKKMCRDMFGLTCDHTDGILKDLPIGTTSPRELMIKVGQLGRTVSPNFWIGKLEEAILKTPQAQLGTYVIADVRFKNEMEWIKRRHGILVRLERSVDLRGPDIKDPSETELDAYDGFDLRIPESENEDAFDLPLVVAKINALVAFR
jgi:phosphomevalonate kinase